MADAAVGAGGEEREALLLALEAVAGGVDESRAGGAEGVAEGERAAERVDLGVVDVADLCVSALEVLFAERVRAERREVGQDLRTVPRCAFRFSLITRVVSRVSSP